MVGSLSYSFSFDSKFGSISSSNNNMIFINVLLGKTHYIFIRRLFMSTLTNILEFLQISWN
jgi:hypothetical protein